MQRDVDFQNLPKNWQVCESSTKEMIGMAGMDDCVAVNPLYTESPLLVCAAPVFTRRMSNDPTPRDKQTHFPLALAPARGCERLRK